MDKIPEPFEKRNSMRPIKNEYILAAERQGCQDMNSFIEKLLSRIREEMDKSEDLRAKMILQAPPEGEK